MKQLSIFLFMLSLLVSTAVSAESLSELSQGCARGNASDCYQWGFRLYLQGDVESGKKHIQFACDKGKLESACKFLKDNVQTESIEKLYRAKQEGDLDRLRKACNDGEKGECLSFAKLALVHGRHKEARDVVEAGCASNSEEACLMLSGLLIRKGSSVSERERGRKLAEESCSKGYERACVFMQEIQSMEEGLRVKQSSIPDLCDEGNASDCVQKAMKATNHGDLETGKRFFTVACALKEKGACHAVGAIEETQGNFDDAIIYYKKSSDLQNTMGDFNLGLLLKRQKKHEEAVLALRKACDAGILEACKEL